MDSPPLTAEQVFLIADPPVTLREVAAEATPSVKVDLKARLAIEINKRLLDSNGEARNILKKQLKSLLSGQMSKVEEQKHLEELISMKEKNRPLIEDKILSKQSSLFKIREKLAYQMKEKRYKHMTTRQKQIFDDNIANKYMVDSIKKLEDELEDLNLQHKGIKTTPEYLSIQRSIKAAQKLYKQIDYEFMTELMGDFVLEESPEELAARNLRMDSIKKRLHDAKENGRILVARKNEIVNNQKNRPLAVIDELKDIDKSIVEKSLKQRELEDLALISLNKKSDINPGAFQKSRNELIAESNEVFKNIYNKGMEPHITLPFEAISRYSTINQLFVEDGTGRISNMVLIIYRSAENFGHWCCICRSNDLKTITYFNSYGSYIDKAMDYIPQRFADLSRQNFPYLLKLLSECDYHVEYNDTQLQVMDKRISTCGNWAGLFMRHSRYGGTLKEFVTPFLSVSLNERDDLVLKLTAPYLT
jgi:hypothetical protein